MMVEKYNKVARILFKALSKTNLLKRVSRLLRSLLGMLKDSIWIYPNSIVSKLSNSFLNGLIVYIQLYAITTLATNLPQRKETLNKIPKEVLEQRRNQKLKN